jgi:hypothetical protein
MELITFDKTSKRPPVIHSKIPFITLNAKGQINFSQAAVRMMALTDGDRLILHQDATYRSDWYMEITREDRGFSITMEKTASRVSCAHAIRQMLRSTGRKDRKISFLIRDKPFVSSNTKLWVIDTKNEYK